MTTIAGLGFTSPWLLLALLALPILWLLLRATPPAPIRRAFPAVTMLVGLQDDESVSDRTPWWLLLLRMAAIALAIIGLAGPILNPASRDQGSGPLLVLMDATWAGADGWDTQIERLETLMTDAGRANRPVAILQTTAPNAAEFLSANVWRSRLPGLFPAAWQPDADQITQIRTHLENIEDSFDTFWVSDGLAYSGRQDLIEIVRAKGNLRVLQTGTPVMALRPAQFVDGQVSLTALRATPGSAYSTSVLAQGTDPNGTARLLASATVNFAAGETLATATLSLPPELRARITRFELQNRRSAGAVALTDDNLRRREVALIAGREQREGLELLSPLHYLRQALIPTTDLLDGTIAELIPANPDVIVLADVARVSPTEASLLIDWINTGGTLLRFAGPRLAASEVSRQEEDPLLPVRLRSGGRSVGGSMSWGEPKTLAPFAPESPFFGLTVPAEVSVSSQVVAQPDPSLADRVLAELSDGTPLVTRKISGQGQIVLFHVTANAEWSNLPISGLFVDMLERLAVSNSNQQPTAEDLDGTTWTPSQILNGFGQLRDASARPGVAGPDLVSNSLGPDIHPGLYETNKRKLARNVMSSDSQLTQAQWPADTVIEGTTQSSERPLGGPVLAAALVLLALDVVAALALSGKLALARVALILPLILPLAFPPTQAKAQTDLTDTAAASELILAHVLTGNRDVDRVAQAGLMGLSDTLFFRTSIEPATPVGVDLEKDELSFYPLLYWPVTPDQTTPSDETYARLNTYLRAGGMIVFDTRDANVARFGASSPNGRKLQQLARPLDIPPLEPLPSDHVLTRTFYLLQDFPGRYNGLDVWVEAAPPDAEQVEGMPFRNLNDGVTPVVIGGNDWAAAWAVANDGRALLPVGRGYAGEQQRELAFRFGVNLVMHVLTGNYKSDQVHVPALLDRLGQ
ncbi:DUF4159 domain-containing protein [Aliisedimentitalea scapharcae]|uniref:DUF4159 domain-containing protein n=1 Tax=Aliisedimentitalea scapharcae TaxID=1524259 RepID=A0ABZ2XTP0_9RHOB